MSDPRQALCAAFERAMEGLPDERSDALDEAWALTMDVLCKQHGHEPVRDQCGRPEHDCCVWCRASTPGQAKR